MLLVALQKGQKPRISLPNAYNATPVIHYRPYTLTRTLSHNYPPSSYTSPT